MESESSEPTWETLSAEILSGMREWRLQHPKATLREIEQALDERFYRLRARMLQSRGAALPTDLASQLLARTKGNPKRTGICATCHAALVLLSGPQSVV